MKPSAAGIDAAASIHERSPGLLREEAHDPDHGDDRADPEEEPNLLAPVPDATPVDDVLFLDRHALLAEQRGPRDPAAHGDVGEAPEAHGDQQGEQDRPAHAEPGLLVKPHVEHRDRHDRDDRRDARQLAPLQRQLAARRARGRQSGRGGGELPFSGRGKGAVLTVHGLSVAPVPHVVVFDETSREGFGRTLRSR